jgi:hypothetical protein
MASLQQKLMISLSSAVLFVLVSLPQTYDLTNKVLGGLVGPLTTGGCPTTVGILTHAVVFYLVTRYVMMRNYEACEATKTKRALTAAVIYALLSSPLAFRSVRSVLGAGIASASGCPTLQGTFVHAAVYTAVLVLLMSYRR